MTRASIAGALGCPLAAAWLVLAAAPAVASGLLTGSVGPADLATGGAAIANPGSASGAQFANPAGLAAFDPGFVVGGGLAWGRGEVNVATPATYEADNEVLATIPDLAVVGRRGQLVWGIGLHGTVGSRFDYDKRPDIGLDQGFLSEITIVALPLTLAWEVSDSLRVVVELIGIYGYWRAHFEVPALTEVETMPVDIKHTLDGPGLQAMAGLVWTPDEDWSLGLAARPPGIVWMEGSMAIPGQERQRVDVDLELPAQVQGGLTRHFGDRLWVAYSLRWINSTSFDRSEVHYHRTPSANTSFLPWAKDEWKHSLGAQWQAADNLWLRAGVSHANHIVGNRGISPLAYDADDTRISLGAAWNWGDWRIDSALGWKLADDRKVGADTALAYPGRYESRSALIGGLTATIPM
jgi:long-subunit fatty acid transport protein